MIVVTFQFFAGKNIPMLAFKNLNYLVSCNNYKHHLVLNGKLYYSDIS
jgi:hypothetical protein